MKLDADELEEAAKLLNALNGAAARLAVTGPVPFILPSETWVYIDWDQEAMAHVLVDPR